MSHNPRQVCRSKNLSGAVLPPVNWKACLINVVEVVSPCRDRNRQRKVHARTLVENFSNQPHMTEWVDQSTLEQPLDRLWSNRLVRVFLHRTVFDSSCA
jgi:hypothetical protein